MPAIEYVSARRGSPEAKTAPLESSSRRASTVATSTARCADQPYGTRMQSAISFVGRNYIACPNEVQEMECRCAHF